MVGILAEQDKFKQNLRVPRCLALRQAREGRAGHTCPGYPAGHSCPQFSPSASTKKDPPSSDPVCCIWLATLAGFAFSKVFGHLLELTDKWRENSAGWCYLCHSCVQGCLGSCTAEKSRVAPVTELLHLGLSSPFKGRAVPATPFPCHGMSILGFVCKKQLLSGLPNRCKPHAFGGT